MRRWVVFEHTVEGLFLVALRGRLSAAAAASLRRTGLDLSKKLLPAYPFEIWKQCLEIAVRDLYSHLPRPEAWRRIGHALVEGMARTVIGRATAGVARLLGPLRALRRLEATLKSADNYVEARITERSATCLEVSINEVMGQPTYYQGILEASLAMTGAKGGRVELLSCEGGGATFRVQWSP
ncbi:DUF2378 family protein [Hyalangium sp.]|uniref:DUF2378 family protein n=1 Tax=Hyalangium sp. TaxID=2028555 RepID=UPI00389B0110